MGETKTLFCDFCNDNINEKEKHYKLFIKGRETREVDFCTTKCMIDYLLDQK